MRNFGRLINPALSIFPKGFRQLSSVAPSLMPVLDIGGFKINREECLSKMTFGSEEVNIASHDVFTAIGSDNKKYAVKLVNKARVGEDGIESSYSSSQAKEMAYAEVLASKIGRACAPNQFLDSNVASDGKGNWFVVSLFVPNAITVREARKRMGHVPEDRSESVFALEEADGVANRTVIDGKYNEVLKIPSDIRSKMKRDGYSVKDALADGRIAVKIMSYILGDGDKLHDNKDGNMLLAFLNDYIIDNNKKTITPKVRVINCDPGLSFSGTEMSLSEEDIVRKSIKLLNRTHDSNQMGLEIHGLQPTNFKKVKDEFLVKLLKAVDSGVVDDLIKSAEPHLGQDVKDRIGDMKDRLAVCYLAGKCLKHEIQPDKVEEYVREELPKFRELFNRSTARSVESSVVSR